MKQCPILKCICEIIWSSPLRPNFSLLRTKEGQLFFLEVAWAIKHPFIFKICLPPNHHTYLIFTQKHSIIFHLPLPRKYKRKKTNLKDTLLKHHWRNRFVFSATKTDLIYKDYRLVYKCLFIFMTDWWNVSQASTTPAPTVDTHHLLGGQNIRANTKM